MVLPGLGNSGVIMDDDDVSVWSPLDASRSQIRLLRLEPHTDHNAWPVGQFLVIPLDEMPTYYAISYAWGGPQGVHPVFIDGIELPVTENLCGALRHLRHPVHPRLFWVDAICVSQRNLRERAQQVVLMQRIFRQAAKVCVWLGHGSEPAEYVLGRLQQIAENEASERDNIVQDASAVFLADYQYCESVDFRFREGLEQLSRLDFWNRL